VLSYKAGNIFMSSVRRFFQSTVPLVVLFFGPSVVTAEDSFDPQLAITSVVSELEQTHLSQWKVDEDLVEIWIRTFLDRLDPSRLYFHDSDIREFRKIQAASIERFRRGEFEFPKQVRTRYRTRVRESFALAADELKTINEVSPDSPNSNGFDSYAKHRQELRKRWRSNLMSELFIETRHGRDRSEVLKQIRQRHPRILHQADSMNDERLCQLWLDALAKSYDPHSAYLSPTSLDAYNQTITFATFSLGFGLRQKRSRYEIGWPDPAQRFRQSGIEYVGWTLLSVNRLSGEVIDLVEMHPDDLERDLRTSFGDLETDTEVILELMEPVTHERVTTSWPRFRSSE
jgi:carboxyl-terminal processing protease